MRETHDPVRKGTFSVATLRGPQGRTKQRKRARRVRIGAPDPRLTPVAGVEAVTVRRESELVSCDGLVLPGGESTTMFKLARTFDLFEPIRKRLAGGMPWHDPQNTWSLAFHTGALVP